jgi:hypothetical protein
MPKALASKNVYFSYFDSQKSDQDLQKLITHCVDYYKGRTGDSFKALIILFEQDFDILRLLRAHIDTKVFCIKNEVMIGALYRDSDAPSLHSSNYFPLRTPIPTLVLRDLTAHDLQFLSPGHYGILARLKFLNVFIRKFSLLADKEYTKDRVKEAIFLRNKYWARIGAFCGSSFLIFAFLIILFFRRAS